MYTITSLGTKRIIPDDDYKHVFRIFRNSLRKERKRKKKLEKEKLSVTKGGGILKRKECHMWNSQLNHLHYSVCSVPSIIDAPRSTF